MGGGAHRTPDLFALKRCRDRHELYQFNFNISCLRFFHCVAKGRHSKDNLPLFYINCMRVLTQDYKLFY